jgi:hypothetical protein
MCRVAGIRSRMSAGTILATPSTCTLTMVITQMVTPTLSSYTPCLAVDRMLCGSSVS